MPTIETTLAREEREAAAISPSPVRETPRRDATVLSVYTATIFLSAFLLFLVQPMFSKMVLPRLGGTPAVWNTCMLFFQAALLGGYLYAHLGSRWLGARRHAVLHLILLGVALATLPITIPDGAVPTATSSPIPWLIGVLTVSLGLPFFAMSASGPLLQKWFSETGHPHSANPYFLYAASNVGSLLALLAYPFLIEPRLRLVEQGWWWTAGYATLLVLFIGCALVIMRSRAARDDTPAPRSMTANTAGEPAPDWRQRGVWILLAFVPSSLLLGVTHFLTVDVAAVPLLWILPLALYLLTFVVVFSRRQVVRHEWVVAAHPLLALLLLFTIALGFTGPAVVLFPLHLVSFFVLALALHGELARRRPGASHLTEFYLWMSFGGVLGGMFNVLIAPQVFDSVFEYPLMIGVAAAIRPALRGGDVLTAAGKRCLAIVTGLLIAFLLVAAIDGFDEARSYLPKLLLLVAILASLSVIRHRKLFGTGVGALVVLVPMAQAWSSNTMYRERTFFAVHRVMAAEGGRYNLYSHGTTIHGVQHREPGMTTQPVGYYSSSSPIADVFSSISRPDGRGLGIVGLGTGGLACYRQPADAMTFYEIDPAVEGIARNPDYFSFIEECAPDAGIVLGDARIMLAEVPDATYDLLVLDAFSSDAIPAHLVTREALDLYLAKTRDTGVIVFHISNRHLDLEPVLAALAREAGLVSLIGEHSVSSEESRADRIFGSRWVVMARDSAHLGSLSTSSAWRAPRERPGVESWTDDFSNILSIVTWRH